MITKVEVSQKTMSVSYSYVPLYPSIFSRFPVIQLLSQVAI